MIVRLALSSIPFSQLDNLADYAQGQQPGEPGPPLDPDSVSHLHTPA